MSPKQEPKQIIVVRKDLKMRRGKEIAQGAHASMAFLTNRLRSSPTVGHNDFTAAELAWIEGIFKKVVVQVQSEAELIEVADHARAAGLEVHLIRDAGLTEFGGVPTLTAAGIGPDYADKIDAVTGKLPLY